MSTVVELIPDIRFFLGNLATTEISDADMTIILQQMIDNNTGYTDCDQLYWGTVATLKWLVRASESAQGGAAATGALKKRVEKEGSVRVEEQYDVSGTTASTGGYDKLLTTLLASPKDVGCTITVATSTGTSSGGMVLIGGVSQAQADSVYDNTDARTATRRSRNFWGSPLNNGRY